MTEYLDLDDLHQVALRAVGDALTVRGDGLLESALGRPHATVFGADAYPDLYSPVFQGRGPHVHSLAKNHRCLLVSEYEFACSTGSLALR